MGQASIAQLDVVYGRLTRPGFVAKPSDAALGEAPAPLPDRIRAHPHLEDDFVVALATNAGQNDVRSLGHGNLAAATSRQPLKLGPEPAHLIKVNLQAEAFSFTLDENKRRYLELLDGELLLVTNTDAPAAEVVQRYKSLADIERGLRVLKSDIEIGPVYHRLPQRIRAHALLCFMVLILYRVMRMRLKANARAESPTRLREQLQRVHQQTVRTADG